MAGDGRGRKRTRNSQSEEEPPDKAAKFDAKISTQVILVKEKG